MKSDRQKLLPMTLVCLYPLASTFLMTMIWQIAQHYYKPFLGGYYFKWVHLYILENPNWLRGELKVQSQVLFSVYLAVYAILAMLTVLSLCSRRKRPYMAWAMGVIWIADGYWIVWDMLHTNNVCWQYVFNLVEHLLFLIAAVVVSIQYWKLKRAEPELFLRKKRKVFRKKTYVKRF